jgi:hypothetical protein
MFQVFVPNVSFVFRHMNVAYVSHICLQVFFRHECCIYFTHMLSSVLSRCCVCFCNSFKCFSGVFASILDACFKYFICLQTYVAIHLYILKVDRVLHLSPHHMLSHLGVSSPPPSAGDTRCLLPLLSMLVTFGATQAPCGCAKWHGKMTIGADVRTPHPF